MGTDELLVCASVATLCAQHELPLVLWTALHTATTPRLAWEFQPTRVLPWLDS